MGQHVKDMGLLTITRDHNSDADVRCGYLSFPGNIGVLGTTNLEDDRMLEVKAWGRSCGSASLLSLPHLSKLIGNLLLVICAIGKVTWGRREAERAGAIEGAELASG
jgi:hypothetical protein